MENKIKGGYYIKARCIQESEIAHCPPHFREIWDWFLMKANHKPKKLNGRTIERGQLLTTYGAISDALSWKVGYRIERYKKHEIQSAMKWLMKQPMVATTKTTRGMIVTILNYDKYQNQKNYETYNENHNKPTMNLHDKQELKELKNKRKIFLSNSDEFRLSELLYSLILKNNPKAKKPNLQSWSKHIDLALRVDNRSAADLEKVIRWCQQDDFWASNILSTQKLRKQFDQLWTKMGREQGGNWRTT